MQAYMTDKTKVFHETDGFIFAADDQPYGPGTCTTLLKWKPPELNSFDFLFRVTQESSGLTVARLMVVHMADEIEFQNTGKSTIQINPRGNPERQKKADYLLSLDGKIIETCLRPKANATNPKDRAWSILRERTDKTHPNSYNTCKNVLKSIDEGVTEEKIMTTIRNQEHKAIKRARELELDSKQAQKRQRF